MKLKQPLVICATGYPLHGDAMSGYLSGFYEVTSVGHSLWQDGLKELHTLLASGRPVAVIVDDTFPHEPGLVAQRITATRSRNGEQSGLGLIYVDAQPNIFRVLRCLDQGYHGYLFIGDDLSASLKSVIDRTRHGERCLSTTVRGLYERYTLYQGLFSTLSDALMSTFKMMGEGLTVQQMVARSGLRPSVIYRRQFRLRQHFGVASNEQLLELIQGMFDDQVAAPVS
jgi:hypothetical protein